jgi:prolyl-tRNA synthetase
VFAVVRGDTDLSEIKVANAAQAKALRPAREEEIQAIRAVPGYASPIDVQGALVVVDDLIRDSPNLVAGANAEGYHLLNVNYGRDYQAEIVADIAAAEDGAACPECGAEMRAFRGVEVGNIFQLGSRYSDSLGCTFLDREGERKPVLMGSYGIGVGRLLACIVQEHHDEYGPIWPISVAPYHVYLIALGSGQEVADRLYRDLEDEGIEVLYDDRNESPGVSFNDADLIGNPLRVTVSKRSLEQGGVEIKRRTSRERFIIPVDESVLWLRDEICDQQAAMLDTAVEVPYQA